MVRECDPSTGGLQGGGSLGRSWPEAAAAGDASATDGAAGVWLLATGDFGWSSARWLMVRLSSLEEQAVVLVDHVGPRSKDDGNRARWASSRGERDGDGERGICFSSTQRQG
jgi:hypothetical protein